MSATWTTRDNKTLLISDMETSHLINCMDFIKCNNFEIEIVTGDVWHGEVSGDVEVMNVEHKYKEMKLELAKRGVNKNE